LKRTDLVRLLTARECLLVRHGSSHDWYQNPATKVSQPVPRHREIADTLAKHILKMLG
jgi:HicA toxin of bacterial toxin-antitoxin,